MSEKDKLYGSTATYMIERVMLDGGMRMTETYQVDVDELALIYSESKDIPVQFNKDKRFEIQALAKAYLKLRAAKNDRTN